MDGIVVGGGNTLNMNEVSKVVALDQNSNASFVSLRDGELVEGRLAQEVLE